MAELIKNPGFMFKGIMHLPAGNIEKDYKKLPDDEYFIFADSSGIHSKESVTFFNERGSISIINIAGRFIEWERNGLPVNTDTRERLSGSCMCQLRQWG